MAKVKKHFNYLYFKENLIRARQSKNLTQSELADLVSISAATISDYENGKKEPKMINLISLAMALEVSVDYLCGTDEGSSCEQYPAVALYRAMKGCNLKVSDITDNTVILSFSDSLPQISAFAIHSYFEEIKAIQGLVDIYKERAYGEELIKKAEKDLYYHFRHLPDLPDYVAPVKLNADKKGRPQKSIEPDDEEYSNEATDK